MCVFVCIGVCERVCIGVCARVCVCVCVCACMCMCVWLFWLKLNILHATYRCLNGKFPRNAGLSITVLPEFSAVGTAVLPEFSAVGQRMERCGNGEEEEEWETIDDCGDPLDLIYWQTRHPPKTTDARQNPQLQAPTNHMHYLWGPYMQRRNHKTIWEGVTFRGFRWIWSYFPTV